MIDDVTHVAVANSTGSIHLRPHSASFTNRDDKTSFPLALLAPRAIPPF